MNLVLFILLLVFILLLQSYIYRKFSLKKVKYFRSFSKRLVSEGDQVQMTEILENGKILPLPWVRVETKNDEKLQFYHLDNTKASGQFHCSVFFLGPFQKIRRIHHVDCLHRGFVRLYQTSLTCGDLLGFNERFQEIPGEVHLYIAPKIPSDNTIPSSMKRITGELSARRWILPDPILISGIREYQTSDNPKDIHWKATAKTGTLQVKVRDFTVSPKLLVILNIQLSDQVWDQMEYSQQEQVEPYIQQCAYLINWALSQGMEVGFCTNAEMAIPYSSNYFISPLKGGSVAWEELMETLSKIIIQSKINFHTMLDQLKESSITENDIVIISPYWNEDLQRRAEHLIDLGNTVHIVTGNGGH